MRTPDGSASLASFRISCVAMSTLPRHDGQDDGARVLHVPLDHVADELDVGLTGEARRGRAEDTWHVDDRQVVLLGTVDLDLQDVLAERAEAVAEVVRLPGPDAHGLVGILEYLGEVVVLRVRHVAVELLKPVLARRVGAVPRDDRDGDAAVLVADAGDLRRVSRAEARVSREREAREALEHRALARRLVTDHDELRKRDGRAEAQLSQLVDDRQHLLVAQAVGGL